MNSKFEFKKGDIVCLIDSICVRGDAGSEYVGILLSEGEMWGDGVVFDIFWFKEERTSIIEGRYITKVAKVTIS